MRPASPPKPPPGPTYRFPIQKCSTRLPEGKKPVALVACGSFSPITYLHLRLFEQARDWLGKNEPDWHVIGGYLSPVTDAYGKKDLASAPHRVAMCELGTKDSDWIMTDTWESGQKEYQRTITVLEHFHKALNDQLAARFGMDVKTMFLCGADLVESFAKPGVWADEDIHAILGNFGVICLERADLNLKKLIYTHDILYQHEKDIRIIPQWIGNDISSTKVRQCIHRGLSIKYLLPDNVIDYIYEHKLFDCAPRKPCL